MPNVFRVPTQGPPSMGRHGNIIIPYSFLVESFHPLGPDHPTTTWMKWWKHKGPNLWQVNPCGLPLLGLCLIPAITKVRISFILELLGTRSFAFLWASPMWNKENIEAMSLVGPTPSSCSCWTSMCILSFQMIIPSWLSTPFDTNFPNTKVLCWPSSRLVGPT